MASLIFLATALASLVSGAVLDGDAPNRLTRGTGQYVASLPPCQNFFPAFEYQGCYDDSRQRVLPWVITGLNGSAMTPEYCQAACKANYFKYAGVEYSSQCFCNVALSGVKRSNGECNMPCAGDQTEDCGGSSRVAVYQDKTFDTVSPGATTGFESQGCYSEATTPPALSIAQSYLSSATMTVDICLEACKSRGFPLAGLSQGDKCSCSVVLADGSVPADSEMCSMPCAGRTDQICGDRDYYSLWVSDELRESRPCDPATFPDY